MDHQQTSTAKNKTYRVWADHVIRVYQDVEAANPQEALDSAYGQPECWENRYEFEDRDDYQLSHEVEDIETGERLVVGDGERCRTCGSEIVETVNGSNFREGECGPCEYRRYRGQPSLLEAAQQAYTVLCDLSYHWCFRGKSKRFADANEVVSVLATAINNAHEDAA